MKKKRELQYILEQFFVRAKTLQISVLLCPFMIYLSLHWFNHLIHMYCSSKPHGYPKSSYLKHVVPDPWHFVTDLDANPYPRIRTTD